MSQRRDPSNGQQATWHNPDGTTIETSAGMDPVSTSTELHVDSGTPKRSLVSPTRHFAVELLLSSDTGDDPRERTLLIAGLTFEEGSGIFQQGSVQLLGIASRVQSSGD